MVFEAHCMSCPCTEHLLFNYAKVKTVFHSMAPLRFYPFFLNNVNERKTVTCKSAGRSLAGLCRNDCFQYKQWPPHVCCPALILLYSILWLRSCCSFPDGDR